MLRIAIDFHNTLAGLAEEVLKLHNEKHDSRLTKEQWTSWQVWDVLPMGKEEFWEYITFINKEGWNATLPPVEAGLGEKICRLHNYYPTCEVLTAMPDEAGKDVVTFLRNNACPALKVNTLGKAKAMGEEKYNWPFDIYVDDQPYLVGKTPPGKFLLLYSQPWNEGVTPNGINEWRVTSWEEAIQHIHLLQRVL